MALASVKYNVYVNYKSFAEYIGKNKRGPIEKGIIHNMFSLQEHIENVFKTTVAT